MRSDRMQRLLAVCGAFLLSACGAHYAQVPARLQLEPYGRLALVTFSTDRAGGDSLDALATRHFAEALLASQSHIELVELGLSDSTVRRFGPAADPAALAQALGRDRDVAAVFLGRLNMSNVKPRGVVASVRDLRVGADVSGELTVSLVSARTGGTVWRSSAAASQQVGHVSLSDAHPSVAVRDPDEASREIVRQLVTGVTRDLRPTWVKQ
ncbi:MAG TPA: hypothetical protein VJQ46_03810 [Gemmatimonadales bacterium]|nr:hypothetical protein [Gemmatimonadales bacterium]